MLRSFILRTLLTNSGITALGLTNSILLSRWLGPTGRGEVAAAMLWPMLLVYLSSMGLLVSTIYFTSLPDSKPQIVFNNSILLGVIISAITLPISFMALPLLLKSQTPQVVLASRLFLLVIPISLLTQFGTSILQGRMQLVEFNWLRFIIPFGYLTGTISLWALSQLTLIRILLLHLILNATVLIATIAVLARSGIYPGIHTDGSLAKRMLKYGAKVHVGNVSGLANMNLAQVFMAAWLAPSYLGLYVVAVSAAGLSQAFSQAVQTVSTPGIAQKKTESERVEILVRIFRQYWLVSLLIGLMLGVTLPILIPLVFGGGFKDAIWPAEILVLGSCIVGAKQVLAGGAQALGNPWLGSKAQLYALAVTVVLLYFLLPRFGLLGAAIATTVAYSAELAVVIYGLRGYSIAPSSLFRIKPGDLHLRRLLIQMLKLRNEPIVEDRT